jgi:DNA-directed RNA polymerase subunit alpha
MTEVLLQIKQLRLKLHDIQSTRIQLEITGEGTITAADLDYPAEVELVNPDLYLFTMDDEKAKLEMELAVQRGRGYSPAEERGRLPVGELPIDAMFSPVRSVNWNVERARVGQKTGYDKLIMEIWTDGTSSPEEALSTSAAILTHHLHDIAGVTEDPFAEQEEQEPETLVSSEIQEMPIERLDLSIRVFNALRRTGITTVGEILEHMSQGQEVMLAIRNFGQKSYDELRDSLSEHGFLDSEDEEHIDESEDDKIGIEE